LAALDFAAARAPELRALLAARPLDGGAVRLMRVALREACEAVLFSDLSFAVAKDVEAFCWRNCFYRFIEEFRRRIRKYSAAAAAGEPRARESLDKARGCVSNAARLLTLCRPSPSSRASSATPPSSTRSSAGGCRRRSGARRRGWRRAPPGAPPPPRRTWPRRAARSTRAT